MLVQIHRRKRLGLDDVFLLVACVLLVASTALLYVIVDALYLEEALTINPGSVSFDLDSISEITWYQKVVYGYLDLSIATVYAVKFSFLCFFRLLIDRLRGMIIYWRIVVTVTAITLAFTVCTPFISCPDFDLSSFECLGDAAFAKSVALAAAGSVLDITTDLMIIAIPARILWQVRIARRQKVVLGLTLCLSVWMMITCVIQIGGLSVAGTGNAEGTAGQSLDTVWQVFWQQVEASIAVTVLSFTGFRSLFAGSRSGSKERKHLHWYSWSGKFGSPRKGGSSNSDTIDGSPALSLSAIRRMQQPHRTYVSASGVGSTSDEELWVGLSAQGWAEARHPENAADESFETNYIRDLRDPVDTHRSLSSLPRHTLQATNVI
ncbi:hypothetical protein MMC19_002196 [Ptychographa xylographoides]|nr:hypothetical protein [Ptychographa xylographoides]